MRLWEIVLKWIKWLTEHYWRWCKRVLLVRVCILLSSSYALNLRKALLLITIKLILIISFNLFTNSYFCGIQILVWVRSHHPVLKRPVMIWLLVFLLSRKSRVGCLTDLIERIWGDLLFIITMQFLKKLVDVICGCCFWISLVVWAGIFTWMLTASTFVSLTFLMVRFGRFCGPSLWVVVMEFVVVP